jgi:cardiolipin synthase
MDSHFEVLTNAAQFYPAMLSAIREARHSINIECYIVRPDEIGRTFMVAMMERARAGVSVKLVVDAVGSFRFGFSAIREMRAAGCTVELYQRFKWYRLSRLNNRLHRHRQARCEDRHHRARFSHRSAMGAARQPAQIQRAAA